MPHPLEVQPPQSPSPALKGHLHRELLTFGFFTIKLMERSDLAICCLFAVCAFSSLDFGTSRSAQKRHVK